MLAPRRGFSLVGATFGLALAAAALSSCHNGGAGNTVPGGGAGGSVGIGPAGTGGANGTGGAGNGTGGTIGAAGGTNGRGSGTSGAAGAPSAGSGGIGGASDATSNGNGGRGGASGAAGSGNGAAGGIGGGGSLLAAGVRWFGRVDMTDPMRPRFGWSGTGFIARLTGTALSVSLNNAGAFVFKSVVDGIPQLAFAAAAGQGTYTLATGLAVGTHTVALYRQTEGVYGDSQFLGLTVSGGALGEPPPASGRLIEVVGASVSCGYGDLGVLPCTFSFATESHFDAYESVAARAVNADLIVVAISGRGMYRNTDGTTAGTMPKLYNQILANTATPPGPFPRCLRLS